MYRKYSGSTVGLHPIEDDATGIETTSGPVDALTGAVSYLGTGASARGMSSSRSTTWDFGTLIASVGQDSRNAFASDSDRNAALASASPAQLYGFPLVRGGASASPLDAHPNTSPTLTLSGDHAALHYTENGPAIILDRGVHVFDLELAAQGDYAGASLRLERHGGANAHDMFSATGELAPLTEGGELVFDDVTVGDVTRNSAGALVLTFGSHTTQAQVDAVLQSLAYSSDSEAPPSSVHLVWAFSDGNGGAQGTGGALTTNDGTTVDIVGLNDTPEFSGAGRVVTTVGDWVLPNAVAVLPDGKILVSAASATGSASSFELLRYEADGALDTSFDHDGRVTSTFGGDWFEGSADMTLQPDGRIVVAGILDADGEYHFGVVRYQADGTLDTSFGSGGKAETPGEEFGPGLVASATALQADGKILVAGGSGSQFALTRFNAEGSLDATFGGDGTVLTRVNDGRTGTPNQTDRLEDIALQADGKIVAVGEHHTGRYSPSETVLVRYNPDGTLDTSFDVDGQVMLGSNLGVHALAIQPDGKLLLAGYALDSSFNTDFLLMRYNVDGSLDSTFGSGGKAITHFEPNPPGSAGSAQATSMVLQDDGRIVLAGFDDYGMAVARYNADGSLDTTFAGDGRVTTLGGFFDAAQAVAVQPDGGIVAVGTTTGPASALVRFNEDGTVDHAFRGDRTAIGVRGDYIEDGAPVVLDSALHVVDPELAAQGHYAGATLALARHDGANPDDVFSAMGALAPLTEGGDVVFDGVHVGTVAKNSGGLLALTFNSDATQARVDGVLQALAYANSSDAPPQSVQLDWTFSDGNTGAQGSGGAQSALGASLVPIVGLNDPPTLIWGPGDAEVTYVTGGPPVVMDHDVRVYDAELAARGDYAGTVLRLSRSDAPNPDDVFSATGLLAPLTEGGDLVYSGVTVGRVFANSEGQLIIGFENTAATQARVNGVLESLAYSNSSAAPPASVQIRWTFNDQVLSDSGTGAATVHVETPAQSDAHGATGSRFVFDQPFDAAATVSITGFRSGIDTLVLSDVIFASPPAAVLSPASFVAGPNAAAHDADDYILYDSSTGRVSYDADGSGPQASIVFAMLAGAPALTSTDVHIGGL